MTIDNRVPASHPFPAYFTVMDHADLFELYERAWEMKYKAMVAAGTLPKLESELNDILADHCGLIIYAAVRKWCAKHKQFDHIDVTTCEYQLFVRLAFDAEHRRAAFLAAFPLWSGEPQGWVWGAPEGVQQLDTLLTVKDGKVEREVFEITKPPLEVRRYLKERAEDEREGD